MERSERAGILTTLTTPPRKAFLTLPTRPVDGDSEKPHGPGPLREMLRRLDRGYRGFPATRLVVNPVNMGSRPSFRGTYLEKIQSCESSV
jgi:hypothetical protein